jgi:hypothetical protein
MGPFEEKKVIEIQAIGSAPFCGMMLADLAGLMQVAYRILGGHS